MSEKKIHAAIAAIMAEIGGVGKGRKNVQQGYTFRGIADLYLACQPIMAKHGVHVTPHRVLKDQCWERTTSKGNFQFHVRQRIRFRFYHVDGSFVSCVTTGEAMDTGDKASNKCMSAAMKYALIKKFCIPEEDPDIDTENSSPDVAAGKKEPPPAQKKEEKREEVKAKLDAATVKKIQDGIALLAIGNAMADERKLQGQARADYIRAARLLWVSQRLGHEVESVSSLPPVDGAKVMGAIDEELQKRQQSEAA